VLEEQELNTSLHDRTSFRCGAPELDNYLQRFAAQQFARGVSAVYVLVDSEQPSRILGFYTLSAAQVDVLHISESDRKKLPRYPVPCFRMGRLACSVEHHGQGLGKLLLGCAVERCLKARKQVAAFAMLVDAKNDSAKAFYLHYGFTPCADSPLTLYLPLGSPAS
jgi:GNAT superfamily N-acetyltransferase